MKREPGDNRLNISGLDEVVFAETRLSLVDGDKGRLVIAGHDIEHLVGKSSFEGLCFRLLRGRESDQAEEESVRSRLGAYRLEAFARFRTSEPTAADGMDHLRAAIASFDSTGDDPYENSLRLIAATAVAAAYWSNRQNPQNRLSPDPRLSHAADYLRLLKGRDPSSAETKGLEAYIVAAADHGMNASTFTARVVASTGSDLTSSITAAIGALKGPLHGGAPGPVLDMLRAIERPGNAHRWLERELSEGRRIMGMGHRIYRVRDPRAAVLERTLSELEQEGLKSPILVLARSVEQAAAQLLAEKYPDRPLKANVEFYTAVLLDLIGLKTEVFSPTFAVGRVLGWCAHVAEQKAYGRLVRPQSTYVGPLPNQ